MDDQEIIEGVALEIAITWLRQGAEHRELRGDEDLYPADYALAARRLCQHELNAEQQHDLRLLVSSDLEKGLYTLQCVAWSPGEKTWLEAQGRADIGELSP